MKQTKKSIAAKHRAIADLNREAEAYDELARSYRSEAKRKQRIAAEYRERAEDIAKELLRVENP